MFFLDHFKATVSDFIAKNIAKVFFFKSPKSKLEHGSVKREHGAKRFYLFGFSGFTASLVLLKHFISSGSENVFPVFWEADPRSVL